MSSVKSTEPASHLPSADVPGTGAAESRPDHPGRGGVEPVAGSGVGSAASEVGAQSAGATATGGDSLGSAGGALGEALGSVLRLLLKRGRVEVERVAADGRVRLELRQLQRDRDAMYQKMGREVRNLVEGGEVSHPGIQKGVDRIRELDQRISDVEERAKLQRSAGNAGPGGGGRQDQVG